jgi:hypothetical protein
MNIDLHRFVTKYLSVVFATLMVVSFVSFVSIPFYLGGDPGEMRASESLAQTEFQTPAPAGTQASAPLPDA